MIRSGMTGLAQMHGWRGPTDHAYDARVRITCDLYYTRNFNLWLDLKIMAGTLVSELRNRKGF